MVSRESSRVRLPNTASLSLSVFIIASPLFSSILHPPSSSPRCVAALHFTSLPSIPMESLLQQSRAMCPFLKNTSPTALRTLTTTARPTTPGGGSMSNLHVAARRCPVMSKALAVQSSRQSVTKRFTSDVAGVAGARSLRTCPAKRDLHTTNGNGASLNPGGYEKSDRGEFWVCGRVGWTLANCVMCSSSRLG